MLKAALRAWWIVGLGCSVIGGCGDSGGGGGGGASGVSSGKLLTELTEKENKALCSSYEQQYKAAVLSSKEQYCTVIGIDHTGHVDDCEVVKQECIDGTDYEDELNEDWGCDLQGLVSGKIEGPCTATVADVEACLREDVAREARIGTKYTCENAGDDIEEESGSDPACDQLFAKCPGADF